MEPSFLRSHSRQSRRRRSFTLLDIVVTLVIVSLLALMASATMLSVLNGSKNSGAEATALAAAGDAVGIAANHGQITSSGAIITAAAETPGVAILTPPGIVDSGGYTTAVYVVTPSYGGTADVTVSFPDVVGGTPLLGSPPNTTSSTTPGTPSTPVPVVTVNNYSSTGDTMTWSWPAVTGGTAPYTYYWSVSPNAGATCTSGSSTVPSVTCSGVLQPNTLYTFSVFAQDSVGASSSVGSVSQVSAGPGTTTTLAPLGTTTTLATTITTPDPYVSSNVYGSPHDTMTWSWPAVTGGNGSLTYYWSVSPTSTGCSFGSTPSLSVTCSTLTAGTVYTFSVYAADAYGDASNVASITATAALSAPTTTLAGASTTLIGSLTTPALSVAANTYAVPYDTLAWNWTASSGGHGTISYFWSVSPATSGCSFGETTSQSFTCATAVAGTTYTFSVYAQDPSGDTSAIATITTVATGNHSSSGISTPQPYVNTNVYNGPYSAVEFDWPNVNGGSENYTYYWKILDAYGNVAASGATGATLVADPSLSPGTYYIFEVYAVDTEGASSQTGSVSVLTATSYSGGCYGVCTTLPPSNGGGSGLATPQPSVTVNSGGEMGWSWTPTSGGTGSYTYYYSVSPAACGPKSTTGLSATCSSMVPNTGYTFSVYAVDSSGAQSGTGTVTATQDDLVSNNPSQGQITASASGVAGQALATVSWSDGASGITGSREWVGSTSSCGNGIGETDILYSNNPTSDTQSVIIDSGPLIAGHKYSAFASVTYAGSLHQSACVSFYPSVGPPPTPQTTGLTASSSGATVYWSDTDQGIGTVNVETYSDSQCTVGDHTGDQTYTTSTNTQSGSVAVTGYYNAGQTYSAEVTAVYNGGGASGPGNCVTYTVPGAATTTTPSGGPVPEVTLGYVGLSGNNLDLSWSYATPNNNQSYGVSRVIILCYPAYTYENGAEHIAAGCEAYPATGSTALSTNQTSGAPQVDMNDTTLFGGWVLGAYGVDGFSGPPVGGTAQILIYNAAGKPTYSDPPANTYSDLPENRIKLSTGPTPIWFDTGVTPGFCVFGFCI